jgi:hypothetical protein
MSLHQAIKDHINNSLENDDDTILGHYIATAIVTGNRIANALERLVTVQENMSAAVVRDIESMEAMRNEYEEIKIDTKKET